MGRDLVIALRELSSVVRLKQPNMASRWLMPMGHAAWEWHYLCHDLQVWVYHTEADVTLIEKRLQPVSNTLSLHSTPSGQWTGGVEWQETRCNCVGCLARESSCEYHCVSVLKPPPTVTCALSGFCVCAIKILMMTLHYLFLLLPARRLRQRPSTSRWRRSTPVTPKVRRWSSWRRGRGLLFQVIWWFRIEPTYVILRKMYHTSINDVT